MTFCSKLQRGVKYTKEIHLCLWSKKKSRPGLISHVCLVQISQWKSMYRCFKLNSNRFAHPKSRHLCLALVFLPTNSSRTHSSQCWMFHSSRREPIEQNQCCLYMYAYAKSANHEWSIYTKIKGHKYPTFLTTITKHVWPYIWPRIHVLAAMHILKHEFRDWIRSHFKLSPWDRHLSFQ